jgi:hypothetical protein
MTHKFEFYLTRAILLAVDNFGAAWVESASDW